MADLLVFLKPVLDIFQNPPKHTVPVLLFLSAAANIYLYLHQKHNYPLPAPSALGQEQAAPMSNKVLSGTKTANDLGYDFLVRRVLPMANEAQNAPDGGLRYSESLSILHTFLKKANGALGTVPKDSLLNAAGRAQLENRLEALFEEASRNPE